MEHLKVSEAGGPGGWKGEQPESESGHKFCKALWPKARISALILSVMGSPFSILNREELSPSCGKLLYLKGLQKL